MLRTIHTNVHGPYGLGNHIIQNEYGELDSLTMPTYSAFTLNRLICILLTSFISELNLRAILIFVTDIQFKTSEEHGNLLFTYNYREDTQKI